MRELGITQIFARSPQAKGRVERAAGTFQDRLVTELSDASASTIAEAQTVLERFLPRFNARFRVPAAEPEVAYRPLDPALPLASILSFRHPRSVARDNTVKYRWRTLQLLPGPSGPATPGRRSRCWNARAASSPSCTRGRRSVRARRRRAPGC